MSYIGTGVSQNPPNYKLISEFTATAGQTIFAPSAYSAGYIDVFRNGVKLGAADFTATNGTTVTLTNACAAGDFVRFESIYINPVANAIPATAGAVSGPYLADAGVTQAKLASGVAGTGPTFRATMSGNQTITNNTNTKVALNTELIDTNNCYDPTTNYRFTPNVAGYYQINANVDFAATATRQLYLYASAFKNGSVITSGASVLSIAMGTGSESTVNSSILVYMNGTTDYLELYVYHYDYTASGTTSVVASYTSFSGYLARTA